MLSGAVAILACSGLRAQFGNLGDAQSGVDQLQKYVTAYGETFTVPTDGLLTSITVKLASDAGVNNIDAYVFDWTGAQLGSEVGSPVEGFVSSTSLTDTIFTFAGAGLTLTANTNYAIVFDSVTPSGAVSRIAYDSDGSSYGNGSIISNTNLGAISPDAGLAMTAGTGDLLFEADFTAAPESPALISGGLFLLVGLGFWYYRRGPASQSALATSDSVS